jgi:hypothetical protein
MDDPQPLAGVRVLLVDDVEVVAALAGREKS